MLRVRLITSALLISATALHAEWGTYQADAAHSGHVSGTYKPANFAVRWSKSLGSSALSDVAVGGGEVFVSRTYYFNGTNDSFFAVSAASGNVNWSKNFGSIFSTNAPAFSNGKVYLQTCNHSGDTWLHSFDLNGNYAFKSPFSAQWEEYLSPTVYGGNVYINGGYYGGMYSFNATTGNQNWFGNVPQYDEWTPAVDANYCYAFTGSGSTTPITGKFTVLNRSTGTTRTVVTDSGYDWTGYSMRTSVVLGSMNDAYATNGGRLLAFDTLNPAIKWVKSGGYTGQPVVANQTIYAPRNGGVTAFSESTGEELWVWYISNQSLANIPMVATDNLLFACSADTTYAIDLLTHQTVWTYQASGRLAISDATLYIAGSNGTLTAILLPEPTTLLCVLPLASGLRRRR